MTEQLSILVPAFCMSLFLLCSHIYFGLHVLARGIIFVDLALAQTAALGNIVALTMGAEPDSTLPVVMGLLFSFGAALFLSLVRLIPGKTTREVAIGSIYITTMAIGLVLLSFSPHGSEELKSMLNGNILWVTSHQIIQIGLISVIILVFHYLFRRQFHSLSFDTGEKNGRTFLMELLFFISFAIIITTAVQIVGVLMVFAFLILPAFTASLLVTTFKGRLILGACMGLGITITGGALSLWYDLPTGSTIVSLMGILPLTAGGWKIISYFHKKNMNGLINSG
ncbi:MAG: metal ABC transporter permease [Nitrospinota bacterium]